MSKLDAFLNSLPASGVEKTAEEIAAAKAVLDAAGKAPAIEKTAEEIAAAKAVLDAAAKAPGSIEKTAEEVHLEKLANQNETIEASTTLALIGEELLKTAEEGSVLFECGASLIDASQSMVFGLQKVAADNPAGMITDMVETQEELRKVAEIMSDLAEKSKDEEFTKMASAVVEINNTLFDELAELAEKDDSVANYLQEFHKIPAKA